MHPAPGPVTLGVVSVVDELHQLGGVASRSTLVHLVGRGTLERALASGDVIRLARGRYGLPQLDAALAVAVQLNGALCLTNAALYHGWEVKQVPRRPHVLVPKWRSRPVPCTAVVHRANLPSSHIDRLATTRETTLEQCMRSLPFDEALVIADSALRHGVAQSVLDGIADRAKGPGSPQMRKVARLASGLAANPFESVLRAIAIEVPGLTVQPQVRVRTGVRSDLADDRLRIVLEADSFQWHGSRAALARDARRYNLLVVDGWLVLRFAWEDVMHDPGYVREVLLAATALAERLTEVAFRRRNAA
jgi:very-short-patch-repair endonuclease